MSPTPENTRRAFDRGGVPNLQRWPTVRSHSLRRIGVFLVLLPACRDQGPGIGGPSPALSGAADAAPAHGQVEFGGYHDPVSAPKEPAFSMDSFQGAAVCGTCHPQHFDEWRRSQHAHAMSDPVFRALVRRQRTERATTRDRFCTQCHTSLGTRSGDVRPGFEFEDLSQVSQQGVHCESCHRVTDLARPYNAGHELDPEAPLAATIRDAGAPHPSRYSGLHAKSKFCGGCHDVRGSDGLRLEKPFEEWLASPAQESGKTCQDCHMPSYDGRASTQGEGPRRTLHRHTFIGVDLPLGLQDELPANEVAELRQASESLLRSAAVVEVTVHWPEPQRVELDVSLRSLLAGHNFPTGSSNFRQCWLNVEVHDGETDELLWQSGHLDARGDLYDRFHDEAHDEDPQLTILGSYLLDEKGRPTLFPWRAAEHVHHSLEPLEARDHSYEVHLSKPTRFVRVRARLRFRSFAPRLLRELDIEQHLDELQVVDVATAQTEFTIEP